MTAAFGLYEDGDTPGVYRWSLQSGNGEGYTTKAGAREGINDVKWLAPTATTNDKT